MNSEQRQEKLIEKLSLEGMKNWGIEYQERAKTIMKKYHDIFALELYRIRKNKYCETCDKSE